MAIVLDLPLTFSFTSHRTKQLTMEKVLKLYQAIKSALIQESRI